LSAIALKKVVERSGCWHKSAIMAVPASAVIIKMLRFPADLNNDELESRVELEVDRFIPYSLDEVSLDFEVLGSSQDCPEIVDVLLAACRKEKVAALEVGGLQAEVVDVESFVLDNTLPLIRDQFSQVNETLAIAQENLREKTAKSGKP